jgi:hypothetical protein
MGMVTTKLPTVQRPRPIDATGWFWSFVLVLAGLFYRQIWPTLGILLLLASLGCFVWQFAKWRSDSAIKNDATNWCRKYYPDAGGAPVVDFMIAVAHQTAPDFGNWSPGTPLDDVSWTWDDDQAEYGYPEAQDRTQAWLFDILAVAKIPTTDDSHFLGATLGDAIEVLLAGHKSG